MLFNTADFGLFLVTVLVIYWSLARYQAARLSFLLAASYYFYAFWNPWYLFLLFGVTLIDFVASHLLELSERRWVKRTILFGVVAANLGVLAYWKYASFLLGNLHGFFESMGFSVPTQIDVVLPVGISFFTFQGLSYVVDVYRGDISAERSFSRFALYIAFFSQLVAGPIVRAKDLLHQFDKPMRLTNTLFGAGLFLILAGLMKKAVFSDFLAVNLIDRVYDNPEMYGSWEVLAAAYGYSLQIYGDFAGYTDIAIGTALLLGFKLPDNFNLPYRADSFRGFWHRWHISLSTWLRDYLYIPLGGSRKGASRTYCALIVTMLLGGLWHGASWTFVLWGALHGAFLVLERANRDLKAWDGRAPQRVGLDRVEILNRWKASSLMLRPLLFLKGWATYITLLSLGLIQPVFVFAAQSFRVLVHFFEPLFAWRGMRFLLVFHGVTLLWIFFRADSMEHAQMIFSQIGAGISGTPNLSWPVLLVLIGGFAIHWSPLKLHTVAKNSFIQAPAWAQALVVLGVLHFLRYIYTEAPQPFIYFQF
jgi:D-alanyl-lipoteichoic acid acyltransferase DltB (MBOAT superfamily)